MPCAAAGKGKTSGALELLAWLALGSANSRGVGCGHATAQGSIALPAASGVAAG